jgi:predicted lipid-binding transport protein (Tim44 family)
VALADRGDGSDGGGMRAAGVALLSLLLAAPAAWAGAGSGSANYGGGGGGGGGGSFGGGGGFSGGGGSYGGGGYYGGGGSPGGGGATIPPGFAILIVVALLLWFVVGPAISVGGRKFTLSLRAWRKHRRAQQAREERAKHLRRTELAAAEAAAEDAAFDGDAIRAQAVRLFRDVQVAWDGRDREALARLVGPDLLAEWVRRLDDFEARGWHNRVRVLAPPDIELIRIHNAAADAEDRVVVHVSAHTRDYVEAIGGRRVNRVGEAGDEVQLDEYWHLRRVPSGWQLESIEQEAEGAYNLTAENVATPWGDDQRLHDEAVAERAAADAAPAGVSPAELVDVDFAGPARAKAMDLSLADGRFDVDLIEASVRRAVEAWAAAVDGADDALLAAARPDVAHALLYPDDASRVVVRGPRIVAIRITELEPPTLAVEVDVRGRRYLENRDTQAVVSGSRDDEVAFTERWTLALDGTGEWPWRIADVGAPAQSPAA